MNDLKFAFRQLLKNPGFAAVAVLTLALGIAATTVVFSLIQGVLLTPPPYPKPEQIILISPAKTDGQPYAMGCTAAQWVEWRKEAKAFEAIAGYVWTFDFLILPDGSESFRGLEVTPDYFKVIGTRPLLGRTAVVGIYGVLSLSVGSRRREIAIRMAVGAQRLEHSRLGVGPRDATHHSRASRRCGRGAPLLPGSRRFPLWRSADGSGDVDRSRNALCGHCPIGLLAAREACDPSRSDGNSPL